jgi:hypothetical protein
VILDQVAQRAGPGGGGAPTRCGGLDDAPSLGGQVAGGLQGDFSRAQRLFFSGAFIPVPRSVRVAFPGREASGPGGGPGRLPGAGGQAVWALAATARATAWLTAAGSARMTTFAPAMVLAVSLGAIQMTRQPEAASRVMSFCPSACWVPL